MENINENVYADVNENVEAQVTDTVEDQYNMIEGDQDYYPATQDEPDDTKEKAMIIGGTIVGTAAAIYAGKKLVDHFRKPKDAPVEKKGLFGRGGFLGTGIELRSPIHVIREEKKAENTEKGSDPAPTQTSADNTTTN